MVNFAEQLILKNQQLKQENISLTIEQHGTKLVLRGTLPPKPSSTIANHHQQRLFLGIPATTKGLTATVAKAREISSKLIFNEFDWKDYSKKRETMLGEGLCGLCVHICPHGQPKKK